ncbi:MAG: ribbon-helix-helix protein, CopG family [Acidobacteriota bacterium]
MRTTILLPDSLFRETKAAAAASGRTVTALIEDALRERLARRSPGGKRPSRARLPVSRRKRGLRPGIDLDDSGALLEVMDGRE